jgi:hypothetical protein
MNKTNDAFMLFLLTSLALGCGGSALTSGGRGGAAGTGQGGANASGGAGGSGGVGAGGLVGSGGSPAAGGTKSNTGGGAGGKGAATAGGSMTGGKSGTNVGGSVTGGSSGAGGAMCLPVACPAIACLYGEAPNPDPCGCPICVLPDAGTGKDAGPDACLALPCAYPLCPAGYAVSTPLCGCPACVPVDAGQPDSRVCLPIPCPPVKCANGYVPTFDLCGCTTCTAVDAGTDSGKLDCVGLDECTCGNSKGCEVISESCYCPFPQCSSQGACICGGGHFLGCAPSNLATCSAAKARVATLCPQLKGATFDSLCLQPGSACITKCLNDVTACGEINCAFCEACDCAGDVFTQCRAKCGGTLLQ